MISVTPDRVRNGPGAYDPVTGRFVILAGADARGRSLTWDYDLSAGRWTGLRTESQRDPMWTAEGARIPGQAVFEQITPQPIPPNRFEELLPPRQGVWQITSAYGAEGTVRLVRESSRSAGVVGYHVYRGACGVTNFGRQSFDTEKVFEQGRTLQKLTAAPIAHTVFDDRSDQKSVSQTETT